MGPIILAVFLVSLSFLLVSMFAKSKFIYSERKSSSVHVGDNANFEQGRENHGSHVVGIYLLHFLLLIATPWLIILILGRPSLNPPTPNKLVCNQASSNASCLTSLEFLFFQTDSRYHYGIKDYGVFLPSFIPAFLIGLWATINRSNKKHLSITLILITGLILTVLISKDSGFLSVLWSVVPISVLATLGFYKMLYGLMSKQSGLTVKTFVLLNFGLLVYETARFYQIIIFHKPFS